MRAALLSATLDEIMDTFAISDIHDRVQRDGLALKRGSSFRSFVWGDQILAIVESSSYPDKRVLTTFHWGFNPVSHTMGALRVETASTMLVWAESYATRRALVPISLRSEGDEPARLVVAGAVFDPSGLNVSLITAPENPFVQPIRKGRKPRRGPLVIPEQFWRLWLSPMETDPDAFIEEIILVSTVEKSGVCR